MCELWTAPLLLRFSSKLVGTLSSDPHPSPHTHSFIMIANSLLGLSFATPYGSIKTDGIVHLSSASASPSPLPSSSIAMPFSTQLSSISNSIASSPSSSTSTSVVLSDGSLMSVEVGSVSVYEFGRTTVQKGVFFRGRQLPTSTASSSSSSISSSNSQSNHDSYLHQIRGDLQSLLLNNYSEWDDHTRETLLKLVEGEPYISASSSSSTSTSTSISSASVTPTPSKSESSAEDIVYFSSPESTPSPSIVASSSSSSSSKSYIESVRSELDELLYTHSSDDGMRETLLQLMHADECNDKLPSTSSSEDIQQDANIIPANTVLWSTPITRILSSSSRSSIQVGPHEHAELNKHMMECYVNHSCAPNLCLHSYNRTTKCVTFRSVAPIKVGDQLCVDYEHTEDRLAWPFTCNCCQETCRGIIIGKEARGASA